MTDNATKHYFAPSLNSCRSLSHAFSVKLLIPRSFCLSHGDGKIEICSVFYFAFCGTNTWMEESEKEDNWKLLITVGLANHRVTKSAAGKLWIDRKLEKDVNRAWEFLQQDMDHIWKILRRIQNLIGFSFGGVCSVEFQWFHPFDVKFHWIRFLAIKCLVFLLKYWEKLGYFEKKRSSIAFKL